MLERKLKFIGIGAYRSGTTWLTQCLREHPDVCIPQLKELEFFNKKYENGKFLYSNYDKGLGWYEEQFRECDASVSNWGEFSNAYLYDKDAPKLIKDMLPDIKLILCLRNPVDRAYSDYLWDKLNFSKEIHKNNNLDEIKKGIYIEHSLYGNHIKNYLDFFDASNVHVIIFDSIAKKPQETIDNVCKFLGIKSFTPLSLEKKVNPAAKAKFKSLTYLFKLRKKIEEKNLGIIIDLLKRIGLYSLLQDIYVKINRKPIKKRPLTALQREELKSLFLSDIEKTESLLGIDLSIWK